MKALRMRAFLFCSGCCVEVQATALHTANTSRLYRLRAIEETNNMTVAQKVIEQIGGGVQA